jgi:ATP-binding cassette subfamily B protein
VSTALEALLWRANLLGEALDALLSHNGLGGSARPAPEPSAAALASAHTLERWIEDVAALRGVEAEHVESTYAELPRLLRGSGPALLRVPGLELEQDPVDAEPRGFLALAGASRNRIKLLAPDLSVHELPAALVLSAFCGGALEEEARVTDRVLAESGLPPPRRAAIREHLLRERFGALRLGGCFLLREAPHGSFVRSFIRSVARPLTTLVVSHCCEYALWLFSWWLLGRGVFDGYLDRGWLLAWAFMLVAITPFRMVATSAQAKVSIGFGQLLKQRLLYGAFQLPSEALRSEGAGMLLGRVVEAEAVEALALNGGLLGVVSLIELAVSAAILAVGAAAWLLLPLLLVWVALTVWLGFSYSAALSAWTEARLSITHDLVEKMIGHRTRRTQEPFERAHSGEDEALERYLQRSRVLDRLSVWLSAALPGTFMVLGFLALTHAFAKEQTQSLVAIALAGLLLAYGALSRLLAAASSLGRALVAWDKVGPLLRAARTAPALGSPLFAAGAALARPEAADTVVLDASGVSYRYANRHEPSLHDCSLRIRTGDRILLTGPSGSGKSTFAATLAGLRSPDAGLVLLHGLDRHTLGSAAWRRAVVLTPQFHENHVVSASFAFNLFMGAEWPVSPSALSAAEALCRELGLGDLLESMPGGMLQVIGETGWQLSHGERSRLFIARAILQKPDVLILDESFGALDPENFERALDSVERRVPTIVVIAHP